jgi:hypothetical protein
LTEVIGDSPVRERHILDFVAKSPAMPG